MNSTQADFALIRRYHDAHMDTPFQRQANECLNRIEAEVERLKAKTNERPAFHAGDVFDK